MSKAIICPECIDKANFDKDDAGQNIKVFHNWIPYAAHILTVHQDSARVSWAIQSVKDEITKCNKERLEIPANVKTLIDLIKNHGKTENKLVVGISLNEYEGNQDEQTTPETQSIQIVDNWAERLGDIEKLGKETFMDKPVSNELKAYVAEHLTPVVRKVKKPNQIIDTFYRIFIKPL